MIPYLQELPYNQLEVLLARWARQVMDEAEVVVLVHCNPTSVNTHKDFQNRVWKMNIRLWEKFPNRVLDCAVTDTKYEIMKPFVKVRKGKLFKILKYSVVWYSFLWRL